MNLRFIALAAAGVGLAACMETGSDMAGGTAITTEDAFRAAVVGKTVTFQDSMSLTINADGTVSGPWDGSGITGTWYWDDMYWCREIAIGGVDRGLDCQAWTVDGANATATRDRGAGSTFAYTLS